jgi:hypothetical protein
MKKIEEMNFEELVDHLTMYIHTGLLENGGKGMKGSVTNGIMLAFRWRDAQIKKEKTN